MFTVDLKEFSFATEETISTALGESKRRKCITGGCLLLFNIAIVSCPFLGDMITIETKNSTSMSLWS